MKDKEIGEIRRHIRRDRSNMTAIYGCFVSEGKEIISKFRLSNVSLRYCRPSITAYLSSLFLT